MEQLWETALAISVAHARSPPLDAAVQDRLYDWDLLSTTCSEKDGVHLMMVRRGTMLWQWGSAGYGAHGGGRRREQTWPSRGCSKLCTE